MEEVQESVGREPRTEERHPPSHVIAIGEDGVECVVVVSDAHMGDVDGADTELGDFLDNLPRILSECPGIDVKASQVHLVLNGDIIDYQLEAEDVAMAGAMAFLRAHVAPYVNDKGMRVTYVIGNHETGLHYLLEEMPPRILVGRPHPWDSTMKEHLAQEIRDRMQPYEDGARGRSQFGHGYVEVKYPGPSGTPRSAFVFHGEEINYPVCVRGLCALARRLLRPILAFPFRLPRSTLTSEELANRALGIWHSVELWIASQDEETVGGVYEGLARDPGALRRIATSFCGSPVMRKLVLWALAGGEVPADAAKALAAGSSAAGVEGRLKRSVVALRIWVMAWRIHWVLSRVRRLASAAAWLLRQPRWARYLIPAVSPILLVVSVLALRWPGATYGSTTDFLWTEGLSLGALGTFALLLVLPVIGAYLWFMRGIPGWHTPDDLRKNLGTAKRWLLPLHDCLGDHEAYARSCADSPTPVESYHWCLFGHFHEARVEVAKPEKLRLMDIGSWRDPDPEHPDKAPEWPHRTFATITPGTGPQLWWYPEGRGKPVLIGPHPSGSPAGRQSKDGLWWVAPPVLVPVATPAPTGVTPVAP
jgi:hypothetical protein